MPGQDPRLRGVGARVTTVADLFSQTAQQYMCREALRQRVIRPRSLKKVKGNTVAIVSGAPQYAERRIVSYYAFTTVARRAAIHEIRQVLTVDKSTVAGDFEGRKLFRSALLTHDDEAKTRLLAAFNDETLNGVATDLGQMVLLFQKDSLKNFTFDYEREDVVGGVRTAVIRYAQKRGPESVHINDHGKLINSALRGWLWVRLPDYLPVRITMISERSEKKHDIRDEAEVDYMEFSDGALLPSAVLHRRYDDDILAAEDEFRYSDWQSLK